MRATEAFEAVLARHGRALEAAKTVTEGLVRAIAEEVARSRSAGTGYGPGAQTQAGRGHRHHAQPARLNSGICS